MSDLADVWEETLKRMGLEPTPENTQKLYQAAQEKISEGMRRYLEKQLSESVITRGPSTDDELRQQLAQYVKLRDQEQAVRNLQRMRLMQEANPTPLYVAPAQAQLNIQGALGGGGGSILPGQTYQVNAGEGYGIQGGGYAQGGSQPNYYPPVPQWDILAGLDPSVRDYVQRIIATNAIPGWNPERLTAEDGTLLPVCPFCRVDLQKPPKGLFWVCRFCYFEIPNEFLMRYAGGPRPKALTRISTIEGIPIQGPEKPKQGQRVITLDGEV